MQFYQYEQSMLSTIYTYSCYMNMIVCDGMNTYEGLFILKYGSLFIVNDNLYC